MDGDLPSQGFVWLFTQGVLGFTTAVGLYVAAIMYRGREKDRLEYAAKIEARDAAHDAEVASWTKLYMDAQAERLQDQRTQNEKLASANDLIRTLFENGRAGGQNARAS